MQEGYFNRYLQNRYLGYRYLDIFRHCVFLFIVSCRRELGLTSPQSRLKLKLEAESGTGNCGH